MPATVVAKTGPVSYTVETADCIIWRRHVDQLLHTSGSHDNAPQPSSPVPELDAYLEQYSAPAELQEQPAGINIVPGTPRLAPRPTPDITSPRPGLVESSQRDNVTDLPTGRDHPRRHRRPPDRLTL